MTLDESTFLVRTWDTLLADNYVDLPVPHGPSAEQDSYAPRWGFDFGSSAPVRTHFHVFHTRCTHAGVHSTTALVFL